MCKLAFYQTDLEDSNIHVFKVTEAEERGKNIRTDIFCAQGAVYHNDNYLHIHILDHPFCMTSLLLLLYIIIYMTEIWICVMVHSCPSAFAIDLFYFCGKSLPFNKTWKLLNQIVSCLLYKTNYEYKTWLKIYLERFLAISYYFH